MLTNLLLFINFGANDQLLRLLVGLLIALLDLTLHQQTQPLRKQSDDALSSVVQLMLALFFILGIVLKLCDRDGFCSSVVGINSAYTVSVLLICVGLIGVLLPVSIVAQKLFFSRTVPILLNARTMEPPKLLLGEGKRYHLFLCPHTDTNHFSLQPNSKRIPHVWSQEPHLEHRARSVRHHQAPAAAAATWCGCVSRHRRPRYASFRSLEPRSKHASTRVSYLTLTPPATAWTEDIGDLEGYVRATGVILFFLSKKYFGSRNCLKEIMSSLEQGKPLVLVHEQQEDKGGGPLEALKAECRNDETREAVFSGRTPIAWHRIFHFQNLTLKLIATEMLRNGPKLSELSAASRSELDELVLIQPGEVNVSKLALPQRLVLWCSAGNPGAADVATELMSSVPSGDDAIRVVCSMPDVQALQNNGESDIYMLLYLNADTWIKQGEVLERDVRAARKLQPGLKIVMVHENDKEKGGCEFGDLFGPTPQELIDDGIYRLATN